MINAITIAESGLLGYQQGLNAISNNVSNLNTPGFKSQSEQFADIVDGSSSSGSNAGQAGFGLHSLGTVLNFKSGQLQTTGIDTDVAIDGDGLFSLRAADGSVRYTRAGQFKFNTDGVLVSDVSNEDVLGLDSTGSLASISIAGLKGNPAKATTTILFSGNLSSGVTTNTVNGIKVVDGAGTEHTLSARFDKVTTPPNTWTVTVLDGTAEVGTGTIAFVSGQPDPAQSHVAVTFNPAGQAPVPITLDFSKNVTSAGTGTTSTLAMASQDGVPPGELTKATFDESGVLVLSYSNGQSVHGPRLALARFSSLDAIGSVGDNEFEVKDGKAWQVGVAGEQGFGSVRAGQIEGSNVDLSQQFSDLVIMQRGFQGCTEVVSTASQMIDSLFSMRK